MAVSRAKVIAIPVVLVLWLLVAALGLEAWARFDQRRAERANPRIASWMRVTAEAEAQDETLWQVPYWSYRPNATLDVELEDGRYVVTTNALGLRGPAVELPKPAGVYRVVCIGGSTTVGGWTDETTYPAFLEQVLNERLGGDPVVEVVNAGVSGLNSGGEARKLPDYLALEPDLLVEYNVVNDIAWVLAPRLRGGRLQALLASSVLVRRHLPSWLAWPERDLVAALQAETLVNLERIAAGAQAAGVGLVVADFGVPDPALVDATDLGFLDHNARTVWGLRTQGFAGYRRFVQAYNRLLPEFCARHGVVFAPVAERLSRHPDRFVDICHVDTEGQRLKAELIADTVIERIRAATPSPGLE